MVRMDFPATSLTESWQERRGVPFSRTVQAPHCPSPQPYLVPVRPSSSRSANNSVVSDSDSKTQPFPFICTWIGIAMYSSRAGRQQKFAPGKSGRQGTEEETDHRREREEETQRTRRPEREKVQILGPDENYCF